MRELALRAWHSPTLTTWGAFLVRSMGFLIVLPLALRRLEATEIVLWYLFNAIFGLQWMLDLGFSSTTSRSVAYAAAGVAVVGRAPDQARGDTTPNWELLGRIRTTAAWVYAALGLLSLVLLAVFGTWSLLKPIASVPQETRAWIAWLIVLLVCPLSVFGNQYWSYLEGLNKVALVRRWETFLGVASAVTMVIALLFGGGLLALVASNQVWAIVRVLVYRHLAARTAGPSGTAPRGVLDRGVLAHLWSGAWRSGVGGGMAYGVGYFASLLVAHHEDAATAAAYLLSARLLDAVLQFSQAPFYSRLPVFTRLRAMREIEQLLAATRRAMRVGYWCYIAGFVVLALFAAPILGALRSNAAFVPADLWWLMGIATFSQLYGGMHIQLYSTTNHIIWHIANTGAGVIFLLVTVLLIDRIGVYAVPLGGLCGYAGFYAWYSARHSYLSLGVGFWRYEARVMVPPALVLLVASAFAAFGSR